VYRAAVLSVKTRSSSSTLSRQVSARHTETTLPFSNVALCVIATLWHALYSYSAAFAVLGKKIIAAKR
jgi:hypothetical protein